MHEVVTSIKTWVQRQNYIRNFEKILKGLYGIGLKTLVLWVLLIYWATILLAPFSQ
tara:strand:+ start:411 stop:578 length:168 start_codon:yes stop_codon:yes gene_type:complete